MKRRLIYFVFASLLSATIYWVVAIRPYLTIGRAHLAAPYLDIRADRAGRLTTAPFEEGSMVKQGDMLFSLSSEEEREQQKQTQADVEALQEKLTFCLADLEKTMQEYLNARSDPELGLDAYEQPLQKLNEQQVASNECKALLHVAKEKFKMVTTQVEQKSLTAPFSGVIVQRQKREGDLVQFGDVIYSFCDISRIWVEAMVSEKDIAKIALGQSATVRLQNQKMHGAVSWISPVALPSGEGVPIRISLDSNAHLRPNMRAEVTIQIR